MYFQISRLVKIWDVNGQVPEGSESGWESRLRWTKFSWLEATLLSSALYPAFVLPLTHVWSTTPRFGLTNPIWQTNDYDYERAKMIKNQAWKLRYNFTNRGHGSITWANRDKQGLKIWRASQSVDTLGKKRVLPSFISQLAS